MFESDMWNSETDARDEREHPLPDEFIPPQTAFSAVPPASPAAARLRPARTLRRRRQAVVATLVNGRVLEVSDRPAPPAPKHAPPPAPQGAVGEKVRAALARVRATQRREP